VDTPLAKKADRLAAAGVLPAPLVAELIAEDIAGFRRQRGLARVVVVNVSAAQLPVRVRGVHRRLLVRGVHAVHRVPPAGAGRACPPARRPVRRARWQGRRDAGQVGAGADVRDAVPAGADLVGHQPARRLRLGTGRAAGARPGPAGRGRPPGWPAQSHTDLAFFFKDPVGPAPHALPDQWAALVAFVQGLAAAS
jgi:hypothetical protein